MKYTITICAVFFAAHTANAVLEENKILLGELSQIEKTASECQDEICGYKCALEKLNYDETANEKTITYRKFCKQNTTSIANKCERSQEFVYCLHREAQNEENRIRDKCVEKHGADMFEYRSETLDNLVRKQSFACFMFCFLKDTGNMNEDMSFNLDDKKRNNATVQAMIQECAEAGDKEETKCSKAARRYYCFQDKLHGY